MQRVPEEWREAGRPDGGKHSAASVKRGEAEHLPLRNGTAVSDGGMEGAEAKGEKGGAAGEETLMMELSRLVQRSVKESSWWERRGVDCSILAGALLCLPPGEAPLTPPLLGCSHIAQTTINKHSIGPTSHPVGVFFWLLGDVRCMRF